ncbi:MAG: SAM-dependent methyltransferase [Bacteroidales bacterium]|nr:SAM-dependent methyltransferase [Bacteroidales bacterium]
MDKLLDFITEHLADDPTRLILDKSKWPGIDVESAVNCIESRRKLRGKVPEWYDESRLYFPLKISAEQCSSSATAQYKAALAERIAAKEGWRIADLTGGLGVDCWFFSKKAAEVLYNEMLTPLSDAAGHNFKILGANNITVRNNIAQRGYINDILTGFSPDIIYMDPARRGEGGKKVFLIEECTPDVLTLKDEIFSISRNILIKLSPMADISMVCSRLGSTCREVHIVSSEGECKELLIWMDRDWEGEYCISAVELPAGFPDRPASILTFTPEEEKTSAARLAEEPGEYLFEPGKSLTKAGAFNTTGIRMDICKFGISTHYYTTSSIDKAEFLKGYGKVFEILSSSPLDKRAIKSIGKCYPKAEVTARNIPITSEALRKKIGCASGGDVHIFGLKSDVKGNLLIVGKRTI